MYGPKHWCVDNSKLQENMSLAIDACIHRVNGCPCGDSVIHLYHGADSTEQQEVREKLLVFWKGQIIASQPYVTRSLPFMLTSSWSGRLETTIPGTWSTLICFFFSQVLLQTGLSSSTVPGWPTPSPSDVVPWWSYPQSTTITRTWPQTSVGQHLLKLQRLCAGHYWTQLVNICNAEALSRVPNPPSAVLKQLFSSSNGVISEDTIESAAKKVLLPPHECSIWMNHLRTVVENRHWGAQKAAATQRAKRSQAGGCRSGSSLSPPAANQVISESISVCILILCVCVLHVWCVCSRTCTYTQCISHYWVRGIKYFMTCVINLRQNKARELVPMCHRWLPSAVVDLVCLHMQLVKGLG